MRAQGRHAVAEAIGRVQSGQPAAPEVQLMLLRSRDLHLLFDARNCSAATPRETVHTRVLPSHTRDRSATLNRAPTPLMDPDALYYAERTIRYISGQCSGGRSFAYINASAEDCSTHQSNRDDGAADLADATRCRFFYKLGVRLH